MSQRTTAGELRAALATLRSVEANRKPMRYAPWVLGLLAVIFFRDRVLPFEAEDWIMGLAFVVSLPFLFRFLERQLERQRERAEAKIEALLVGPRGLRDWTELQGSRGFTGLKLSDRVQRAVLNAALAQERRDQERRARVLADDIRGGSGSEREADPGKTRVLPKVRELAKTR